ncbi:MAG: hypothetical protein IJU33_08630 [Bacteroidales bacterium]|nr:hypothetical protein [Bacteroidales bacterium]
MVYKKKTAAAHTSYSKLVQNVFNNMVQSYQEMLNGTPQFCPAFIGSTNKLKIPERNLSFNFCHHYLYNAKKINGVDVYVWQELAIKDGNNQNGHIDSMILDLHENVLLLIEAKRIASGGAKSRSGKVHKCNSLQNDMKRLCKLALPNIQPGEWDIPDDLFTIIQQKQPVVYAMALVDYWKWQNGRKSKNETCKQNFEKCSGNIFVQINTSPIQKVLII